MYKTGFKYSLERGSKKSQCPNCMKKTFVRYIDNETGEYLSHDYGRCDREQKCGYFRTPEKTENYIPETPIQILKPKPSFLPLKYVDHFFDMENEKHNRFVKFLYSFLPEKAVDLVIRDYVISTCFRWGGGATIFWQIDKKENVRTGQVLLYDPETGKRIKEPFNHITWVHKILEKKGKIKDFVLEQCLFGLHLVNDYPDKMVAVVEAPKTACIMAAIFPNYLWMATCGLANIKEETFRPLKEKKIVLYPDLGAYERWKEKAKVLQKLNYNVEVSDLIETKSQPSQEGLDIADYFINKNQISK